jgi:hypothetical protein
MYSKDTSPSWVCTYTTFSFHLSSVCSGVFRFLATVKLASTFAPILSASYNSEAWQLCFTLFDLPKEIRFPRRLNFSEGNRHLPNSHILSLVARIDEANNF